MSTKIRKFWEVRWTDGRTEVVEATNCYHREDLFGFGASRKESRYELVVAGEGVVWTARESLIDAIRCLEPVVAATE